MFDLTLLRTMDTGAEKILIASPVGQLTLIAGNDTLQGLLFESETELCTNELNKIKEGPRNSVLGLAAAQLRSYFSGELKQFTVPMDLKGTEFQRRVWEAVVDIPYGQTATYGEIAESVGNLNKARAVGHANSRNPVAILVPCHRVISTAGKLTGFGGGLSIKQCLLDIERA